MKTLHLLRHAKSSWSPPDFPDHKRDLTPTGQQQADLMARHLGEKVPAPDLVVCSTARRTRDTLPPFLAAWGLPLDPVVFSEELYLAGVSQLFDLVHGLPGESHSALLVGHNPGFTDVLNLLTPPAFHEREIPPCGFFSLEFGGTRWADLAPGGGRVTFALHPLALEASL